jgi:hypothetical protein
MSLKRNGSLVLFCQNFGEFAPDLCKGIVSPVLSRLKVVLLNKVESGAVPLVI